MLDLKQTSAIPPDSLPFAVQAQALTKRFGNHVAVDALSLSVRPEEVLGIVGPDGAGKTTLLQMLAGVVKPTSGTVTIFGEPVTTGRAQAGYVTQQFTLPEDLSVEENMSYAANLRDVPVNRFRSYSDELLNLLGLGNFKERLAGKLSGGMKEKLSIACALIGSPKVIFLDEPATGVDPVARREFQAVLIKLALRGTAVVLATPDFDEVEICDRVVFIHHGKTRKIGNPNDLRTGSNVQRLQLQVADVEGADKLLLQFSNEIVDKYRTRDGIELLAPTAKSDAIGKAIAKVLEDARIAVASIQVTEPTLENIFALSTDEKRSPVLTGSASHDRQTKTYQSDIAIKAEKLVRRFGNFVAVNGVSFTVERGQIYGLLGANGAGKTTVIKMLSGLQKPSSGLVRVLDSDPSLNRKLTHAQMGYMNQKFSLYDGLTVEENIAFYAWTYGIPIQKRKTRVEQMLEQLDLFAARNDYVGRLPRGLKQRVAFAASTIHDPEILFLDEPTAGTDPLTRRRMWTLTNDIAKRGTAVVVTTHYLDEAEFCNRIACMVDGNIVAEGTPAEIQENCKRGVVAVNTQEYKASMQALTEEFATWRLSVAPRQVRVLSDNSDSDTLEIRKLLEQASVRFKSTQIDQCSLEDAFISYIADRGREEG